MLYLDCHKWCEAHHKTMDELLQAGVKVGVIWQDGRAFFLPGQHPDESGAAIFESAGGLSSSG